MRANSPLSKLRLLIMGWATATATRQLTIAINTATDRLLDALMTPPA